MSRIVKVFNDTLTTNQILSRGAAQTGLDSSYALFETARHSELDCFEKYEISSCHF